MIKEAIIAIAEKWMDPEYPPRLQAESATLEAPNRFTEEGLAFVVNYAADYLVTNLEEFKIEDDGSEPAVVGVLLDGETPLQGLFDIIADLCRGNKMIVRVVEASPALIPAFLEEVNEQHGEEVVRFADEADVIRYAEILIGSADHKEEQYVVGVIDGTESRADLSGFAEDILLHEGGTSENVRVLFAPKDHPPDPLLEVLAGFRELFPSHPDTDGSLAMPAAFLQSAGASFAQGPGFLVSRGDPEPQSGAHLRWTEYEDLEDVVQWIAENRENVKAICAAPRPVENLAQAGLPEDIDIIHPGDAHRPTL